MYDIIIYFVLYFLINKIVEFILYYRRIANKLSKNIEDKVLEKYEDL